MSELTIIVLCGLLLVGVCVAVKCHADHPEGF